MPTGSAEACVSIVGGTVALRPRLTMPSPAGVPSTTGDWLAAARRPGAGALTSPAVPIPDSAVTAPAAAPGRGTPSARWTILSAPNSVGPATPPCAAPPQGPGPGTDCSLGIPAKAGSTVVGLGDRNDERGTPGPESPGAIAGVRLGTDRGCTGWPGRPIAARLVAIPADPISLPPGVSPLATKSAGLGAARRIGTPRGAGPDSVSSVLAAGCAGVRSSGEPRAKAPDRGARPAKANPELGVSSRVLPVPRARRSGMRTPLARWPEDTSGVPAPAKGCGALTAAWRRGWAGAGAGVWLTG